MAKTKNKNRINSDELTQKKAFVKSKKDNPFEVHTNKEKFSILGRQLKHDKGMPGVSRAKAMKRRKDTIGQEYLQKNKSNSFKDKRIGERYMTKEQATSARFVAERLKQIKGSNKKQSLFNLNDDDLLTHKGQTLEEIEQFQDTISDNDDDDDEELGKLDAEFTEQAHFGGDDGGGGDVRDRKSAIDDLIAEQKRRKNEIVKEKEEVSELTHKLDENWRSLIPLMAKMSKEDEVRPKPDDYDKAMREMIFLPRGAVSDKLKTEEEIIKVDKEKLERLERERLERMRGITDDDKKVKHRSADDLDDGYYLQPVTANNDVIAYDINGTANDKEHNSDMEDEEEFDKHVKESGKDDDDNSGGEGSSEEDDEESGSEDEDEDNLSDLKEDDSDQDVKVDEKPSKKRKLSETIEDPEKSEEKRLKTEQERKEMMKRAAAELPYTFELPETYEDLEAILKKRNSEYQNIIIQRMIKCNHPKVVPENKEKMITLFAYLLQHVNDTFDSATVTNVQSKFMILDRLCPHLHDLSQINPAETTRCFKEVIKEKQNDFRDRKKQFPGLETLAFLKLVSNIYSTSDFRHQVVTPCMLFISEMLSRCRVESRTDITVGLFLATIILEYTQLSKRFLPAVINFLTGTLYLCLPKRPIEVPRVIPPFRASGESSSLLVLKNSLVKQTEPLLKTTDLLDITDIDESFCVRALNTTLKLTNDIFANLSENVGVQYLIQPVLSNLTKLDLENYPKFVVDNREKCLATLTAIEGKKFKYIVTEAKKPKALRMFEPKFDKVYDDKRIHKPGNKDKAVRDGMIRKIKSETRGAIREIRRDNAFLSKIQLKKQMEKDAERKEKVKRIFSEASVQQGELNAMDRKKKHM